MNCYHQALKALNLEKHTEAVFQRSSVLLKIPQSSQKNTAFLLKLQPSNLQLY